MSDKPDPGEGYRLVDTANEPFREDAEWWRPYDECWRPASGSVYASGRTYRVPVDKPAEGTRPAYAPTVPGWYRLRDGSACRVVASGRKDFPWKEDAPLAVFKRHWTDSGKFFEAAQFYHLDIIGPWVPQVGEWVKYVGPLLPQETELRGQVLKVTDSHAIVDGENRYFLISNLEPADPPAKQEPDELSSLRERLSVIRRERNELRGKLAAAEEMNEERAVEIVNQIWRRNDLMHNGVPLLSNRLSAGYSIRKHPATLTITGPASAVELVRKFAAEHQCEVTG